MKSNPLALLCVALLLVAPTLAADPQPIQRMLTGPYGLPDERFLQFAERTKPDVVVIGTFGAPQWAAEKDHRAWLAQWKATTDRLHAAGIRVIGMCELLTVADNPQQLAAWDDFYQNRWDEELLGPRPGAKAADLIERRELPIDKQIGAFAPRGCAVNPHWRRVMQALIKPVIAAGVDGFITHRNIYGQCGCPFCHADLSTGGSQHAPHHEGHHDEDEPPHSCAHCRDGFRSWLAARYSAAELKRRFDIADLARRPLPPLSGMHRRHDRAPTPLELEALRYSRAAVKDCFDDIFVRFSRKQKPGLLAAQWNHMPYFDELHSDRGHLPPSQLTSFAHAGADERFSLPIDVWGQHEDLFWYCNWGTCQNTQLAKRFVGDVTLYAKLLRSFSRGRPYVINKYDFYRPRNMLAESAALGMISAGKDLPYGNDADEAVTTRYFDFFRRHGEVLANSNGRPDSEILVVYPRTATHQGRATGLDMVAAVGRTLIVDKRQFDLVPDDLLADQRLAAAQVGGETLNDYPIVVAFDSVGLSDSQLTTFQKQGGKLIVVPANDQIAADPKWRSWNATIVNGIKPQSGGSPQADAIRTALQQASSRAHHTLDAPFTVEMHVYRQPQRLAAHLVNYNHREGAAGDSVSQREAPIATEPAALRLALRDGDRVKEVWFADPDGDGRQTLSYSVRDGVLRTTAPGFLCYGLCVVEFEAPPR